jgi:hypothetical protein
VSNKNPASKTCEQALRQKALTADGDKAVHLVWDYRADNTMSGAAASIAKQAQDTMSAENKLCSKYTLRVHFNLTSLTLEIV